MQLDRVEDLYGDRGDRWCALARQVCKKPEAVEAFREDVVNPATPFMRAIQNELNSPAKPLIPAPWSIKRAIRRKRENTITEILVATGTPQENVELRFCLQRAADGEYTIRCTIPNRSPQTGRTVEVADLSMAEPGTAATTVSQCTVLADRSADDRELLLATLDRYKFRFCVVTSAAGRDPKVWLVGVNQFSYDELTKSETTDAGEL